MIKGTDPQEPAGHHILVLTPEDVKALRNLLIAAVRTVGITKRRTRLGELLDALPDPWMHKPGKPLEDHELVRTLRRQIKELEQEVRDLRAISDTEREAALRSIRVIQGELAVTKGALEAAKILYGERKLKS